MADTLVSDAIFDLGHRLDDEQTASGSLLGHTIPGGWTVIGKVERHSASGQTISGSTFSVCYVVQHATDGHAVLKAFDHERALREDDTITNLAFYTRMFQFERDLLTKTSAKKRTARRVVRLIGSGEIRCRFDGEPNSIPIPYLIMERANVDLRMVLSSGKQIEDAWLLSCVRDVAAAIDALHQSAISHCDTKPSNIMYFEALGRSKLGDLGSATTIDIPHPAIVESGSRHLGDPRYAPPEIYYGYLPTEWDERFRAVDLYLLGQLTLYLLSGENMTSRLFNLLPLNFRPVGAQGSWRGTFAAVLPHLELAFDSVIRDVRKHLVNRFEPSVADEIANLIRYLCNPDPAKRGHPSNRNTLSMQNRYGLIRFVSAFSLLVRKAGVRKPALRTSEVA